MIRVESLEFSYGKRAVLKNLSFGVPRGGMMGLLGPNGSGKTTLFRILATLLTPEKGEVKIAGLDASTQAHQIREKIGIVFQSPSLDPKLTVRENLMHQGHLYGISGKKLRNRSQELMRRLGVLDRQHEMVSKLSGGLKRRVELAKGLLHEPEVLILDEPSTGLDPGARIDLWQYLKQLQSEGMTVLVTTHLMEEADFCGQLLILSRGEVVAEGSPDELKSEVGKGVILIRSRDLPGLAEKLKQQLGIESVILENELQVEREASMMSKILEAAPGHIESFTFRKPTLEDVFVHQTGHRFWSDTDEN